MFRLKNRGTSVLDVYRLTPELRNEAEALAKNCSLHEYLRKQL